MPVWLRHALITLGTAFLVVFVYGIFDPTLRDFVYAIILRAYLFGFALVTKFLFQKGVVSMATIAWKRIFFVGGFALMKRFWINFFKKNATEHIVKPLLPHAKKWAAAHLEDFKSQPLWLKISETTLGTIIIVAIGYFVGFLAYLWRIIEAVLTGRFQTFFLSILNMIRKSLGFIWDKIAPWIDVIFITAFFNLVEKIPVIKAAFEKTKKVKDAVVDKKDRAIKAAVHKPVQKVAEVINNHAEKKIQKRNGKAEVA